MKVLVTGATGVLGRAVVPRLLAEGMAVRGMSRRPPVDAGHPVDWVGADLATGRGVDEAVAGTDAVVHLASATPASGGYDAKVDVDGTRLLVETSGRAGVRHLLFVSIVGVDRVPLRYYRFKLAAEADIAAGPVPWSILRATQFPQLLDDMLRVAGRFGPVIGDRGMAAQPVDPRDVADRIADRLRRGPSRDIEEYGGPEVLRLDEAARPWLTAQHRRARLLPIRVPGRFARAVRAGGLLTGARPTGTRTWRDYLIETYQSG